MRRFTDWTEPLIGFVDLAGRDMRIHRYLQTSLPDLFTRWGYEEISVPIVERASSFSEEVVGGSPWPEWDRRGVLYLQLPGYAESYADLPDQEPALLVPEGTISVSRWIAKAHLAQELAYPRKLFYVMPCFRNELISKLSATKTRQFHQIGIEILGTDQTIADLEVLLVAYEGLIRVGIPQECILARMGSVEVFNQVSAETGLSAADTLTVKNLLDTIAEARAGKEPERLAPSIQQVRSIVSNYNPDARVDMQWDAMTTTFAEQVDRRIASAFRYPEMINSLNLLASLASHQGLRCMVDLAVVRSHEYYTGITYEFDVRLPGQPPLVEVAGGGRYNRLVGKFLGPDDSNVTIPAVGFAYGLERLVSIFNQIETRSSGRAVVSSSFQFDGSLADIVLVAGSADTGEVLSCARELREAGRRVDTYVGNASTPPADIEAYARQRGAAVRHARG